MLTKMNLKKKEQIKITIQKNVSIFNQLLYKFIDKKIKTKQIYWILKVKFLNEINSIINKQNQIKLLHYILFDFFDFIYKNNRQVQNNDYYKLIKKGKEESNEYIILLCVEDQTINKIKNEDLIFFFQERITQCEIEYNDGNNNHDNQYCLMTNVVIIVIFIVLIMLIIISVSSK